MFPARSGGFYSIECFLLKERRHAPSEVGMLDFEEELKRFEPSLDIYQAQEAIYNNDFTDITDILAKILFEQEENSLFEQEDIN